ncbi:hypothetical protein L6279_04385 [Candidatus Parcubacteria bacterium]|nr:hypothetical protein [Patescibacteria group bacterium]MCG2693309.1 hypothetical protein [Candidatus Parcubacteria bacterium]
MRILFNKKSRITGIFKFTILKLMTVRTHFATFGGEEPIQQIAALPRR